MGFHDGTCQRIVLGCIPDSLRMGSVIQQACRREHRSFGEDGICLIAELFEQKRQRFWGIPESRTIIIHAYILGRFETHDRLIAFEIVDVEEFGSRFVGSVPDIAKSWVYLPAMLQRHDALSPSKINCEKDEQYGEKDSMAIHDGSYSGRVSRAIRSTSITKPAAQIDSPTYQPLGMS